MCRSVLLPLPVADLPVVLWCRDVRLLGRTGFSGIAGDVHAMVLDSGARRCGMHRPLRRRSSWRQAGDLAWTRLTRWRELIARIFANRGWPPVASLQGEGAIAGAAFGGRIIWRRGRDVLAPAGQVVTPWLLGRRDRDRSGW